MRQILLGITILLSIYSSPLQAQVDVQDSLTLVDIYNSTGGPNWTNHTNWLTANPVSTWYGVTVTEKRVTALDLSANNLTGKIPKLSGLDKLSTLDIAINPLKKLSNLSNLINLDTLIIYDNDLRKLPDLSRLVNLKFFICSSTFIKNLPDLSNLVNLETLDCTNNYLTQLPDLSGLVELKYLNCSENQLIQLPNLSNQKKLEYVSCHHNNLEQLPNLSNLVNLEILECSFNKLKRLPSLDKLINLKELSCTVNQLDKLPNLSKLLNLEQLYCNSNRLTEFPDISNLSNLDRLFVCDNALPIESYNQIIHHSTYPSLGLKFSPQDAAPFFLKGEVKAYIDSTFILKIDRSRGTDTIYEWFKDNVSISKPSRDTFLQIDQLSGQDAGTYHCEALHKGAETMQYSHKFVLDVLPSPNIEVKQNSPVCFGDAIKLMAGGGDIYKWIGPNGFHSTEQNPIIPNADKSNAGTYTVTIKKSGSSITLATTIELLKCR